MISVQERIKQRRLELNLTLLEIAEQLGVREATVQRYESGEIKNIKHGTIMRLSEILRCSPAYLMGWIDETFISNSIDNELFRQKELILEMKEVILVALKAMLDNEHVEQLKEFNDDLFIAALPTIIQKVEIDKENGEMKVYYFLDNNMAKNDINANQTDSKDAKLSTDEISLVEEYRKLSSENKGRIRERVDTLLESQAEMAATLIKGAG